KSTQEGSAVPAADGSPQETRNFQNDQVLSQRGKALRRSGDLGREHDLEEEAPDRVERRVIERRVHAQDAAERGELVAVACAEDRIRDAASRSHRRAGRISMLHDDRSRRRQLVEEEQSRFNVEQIVVRERLSTELRERLERPLRIVERTLLPRILA